MYKNYNYGEKRDTSTRYTVQGYLNGFRLIRRSIEARSEREAAVRMKARHKNITDLRIVNVIVWQDTTRKTSTKATRETL